SSARHAAANRRAGIRPAQYKPAAGARRHRARVRALSLDRRRACRLADLAVAVRTRSGRQHNSACCLSRLAMPSRLGVLDAGFAMDHPDRRGARRNVGVDRPLPFSVASELRRGRWRDRGVATGVLPSADCCHLLHCQRRHAGDPHPRREPCARGVAADDDRRNVMNPPDEAHRPGVAIWLGFILMCLGMFMAILDIQVVATSLPTIQHALAIAPDTISWIQTTYLIAEIIAIPLTGWLTRVMTLRWLFAAAVTLFTLASVGCAFSNNLATLVGFRAVQGFAGGTLIPAVFSAVFLLFPLRLHPVATTLAGIMAVLAPTMGPVVGGWITETYSWHWLFLINVIPGIIVASATPLLLPRHEANLADPATLDLVSLVLMAIALASLEIALKQAPQYGWLSPSSGLLLLLAVAAAILFVVRTLKAIHPVVDLSTLALRPFAISCGLSFCLGVGLYGSVYLMPVFLAFVRRHHAFEIGTIMLVTGAAQLVAAPIAGLMERRYDPRWQSAAGFGLFAIGLGLSAFQSRVA